ncbi:DNA methylase, partial [Shigella boydii]|nr:DNA methylase [Shigella boydii]EFD5412340.1 DNA methylase [Escherichia coli]EAA4888802.1 DNA methylase [Shigella boydii]EAC1015319.1 DNA methylase [Shigella boydii]EFW0985818.1 DNA methylase [Shigella boydii]
RLERCTGKPVCTVLRGGQSSNELSLPDKHPKRTERAGIRI